MTLVRELPDRTLARVGRWQSLVIQARSSYGDALLIQSMRLSQLRFKGTECPQSLSQADFMLDTNFPKWEHFICIGATPVQVYASHIEKTVA